ncbi:pentatricopeptide repeat-containing protein At3g26540-like [Phoenix dactylifera]|uniref:Pentatricopeptide repeat-containing protein At3g26540-like n=1 Tax=Phoenix dactylifera TaxID=42345 RepID=A0A8B8ZSI6_PHODC|nr:pentatricopeptide repeat-containing protein At3g26540-like [Phoenix dactylifera]
MQWETCADEFTFSTILAACANIFMLEHGKEIHGYMIRNGFEMDVIIRGALVDMYSKCRLIEYGIKVFEMESSRDIVLWNSMILGCAYNGRGEYGLELFEAMRKDGIRADNVTLIGILLACISEGYVNLGRRYFDSMTEEYGIIPRVEHYECMIELLGKHGFMVELEDFVEHMPFEPTIPMWTRIFDCCREHGNRKLGERAARCISESNPLNPVQFEVLSPESSDCT